MKKLLSIILCSIMVIVLGSMATGCGNDEVLKKIDDLQAALQTQSGKIDELQTQNSQLTDKLGEVQNQNSQFADKLEEMQTVLDGQGKAIQELKNNVHDMFFTLQEAYDYGLLTQDDLMSIAYYHNVGRIHNEEIMSESYEPSPLTPENLSPEVRLKIRSAAARDLKEMFNLEKAEAKDFVIIEYYGVYNGCAVVYLCRAGGFPALYGGTTKIGNVIFIRYYAYGPEIVVYKF